MIIARQAFDEAIERERKTVKCVVVLGSRNSIASERNWPRAFTMATSSPISPLAGGGKEPAAAELKPEWGSGLRRATAVESEGRADENAAA